MRTPKLSRSLAAVLTAAAITVAGLGTSTADAAPVTTSSKAAHAVSAAAHKSDWASLRVYQANTHVGRAVSPALAQQVRAMDADIVLLQEVRPGAYAELPRLFPGYYLVPGRRDARGQDAESTPVLVSKRRFTVAYSANRQISPFLGGGQHGRLWPSRWRTVAGVDDKVTGRRVVVSSVHTWAAWSTTRAHDGHIAQVEAWSALGHRPADRVVLAGGDWNENLNVPTYARRVLSTVDMAPASARLGEQPQSTSHEGRSRLDDVFFRTSPFIVATGQRVFDIAGGSDHRGVLTTFQVRTLR